MSSEINKTGKMNGRILVGGGTGFIGREVVKVFEKLDYEVVVISRKKKDLRKKFLFNRFINFDTLQDEEPSRGNTQTWHDIEVIFSTAPQL